MKISERAENAAKAIYAVLQVSPTPEQSRQVQRVLEQAIVNAMLEEAERCSNTAVECCSADLDIAHKITEGIRRANQVLMANLSSLR